MKDYRKIAHTAFYIAAAFAYIAAIALFLSQRPSPTSGFVFLCIGSAFLCLGSVFRDSNKKTGIKSNNMPH